MFVYAAGGYYHPGKGLDGLRTEMASYLERGYSVVKMKIGGASLAEDCERIEAVLKMLQPGQQLAVDANGRFDLETGQPRTAPDARGFSPEQAAVLVLVY